MVSPTRWLSLLFFLSGFPALLYQIVWQRALFTIFGVNVESVTVVVSAFMLGLGLGSLLGGWLSQRPGLPLLLAFAFMELAIAAFGVISLQLFQTLSTLGAPSFLLSFAAVVLPTVLMGATLPLLVTHLVRVSGHVGRSVGLLYFVNTLGSAVACFAAALYTMRELGMSGTVELAAAINALIGLTVLVVHFRSVPAPLRPETPSTRGQAIMPFSTGLLLAGVVGFISLGFEILWYRVYSYASGGSPRCFSFVLGAFLAGIALGSWFSSRLRWPIGRLILVATVVSFSTIPAISYLVAFVDYTATLPLIALAAGLLGAVFPLVCHAAVPPDDRAGRRLSFLYLANIAGSVLGSYAIGFILLNLFPLWAICLALSVVGLAVAWLSLGSFRGPLLAAAAVLALLPSLSAVYERLLYKNEYTGQRFTDLVETRSGVVSVDSDRQIYGGGAHDGVLSTNLIEQDSCIRPLSLSYLHPAPHEVLLVGMAGGAWSQIVANHPAVQRAVVVEINGGYLEVIRRYPDVAPVLRNPKVQIFVDDGRRWMREHQAQKFDAILMDTVQHWRAQATNLLSVEMLTLARSMLKPGGIIYYNTTWSEDAQRTGATFFPYVLRFGPFLAVSDSPLQLDENRWRETVARYQLDGRPMLNLADPVHRARLDAVIATARQIDPTGDEYLAFEDGASILRRTTGARITTDNNMATEWTR